MDAVVEEFRLPPATALVHQAVGAIAVLDRTTIVDALRRLETYATEYGRTVDAVARDIVERRLPLP